MTFARYEPVGELIQKLGVIKEPSSLLLRQPAAS